MDILLTKDGDLFVGKSGDIEIENSVEQKIRIRVLWFLNEWRWQPSYGLPWMEYIFVKNPNTALFESALRDAIFSVDEVTSVEKVQVNVNGKTRKASITYVAHTDLETILGEIELDELRNN